MNNKSDRSSSNSGSLSGPSSQTSSPPGLLRKTLKMGGMLAGLFSISLSAQASDLKVADTAPAFSTKTHEGKDFDLNSRKDKWTVLYFYPKAETPGCTKQACAFRDNIEKIRAEGAEVYGISADSVEDQAAFHKNHNLNFTLLADPKGDIVALYGSKMPMVKLSKRWTFILDPKLKIRAIEKDVDPAMDAVKVAGIIKDLQAADQGATPAKK